MMTNNKPAANDILRRLMDEVGITEAELARRTEIPQPTLHRILSGSTRSPRGKSLSPLANFFSITISQLIGDDPLPKDRIPGTYNPSIQGWTSLPIIDLTQAINWQKTKQNLRENQWNQWVTTDMNVSADSYALIMQGQSMAPLFPEGTILVIDTQHAPINNDFVVAHLDNQPQATFKQLLVDGSDKYLKSANPDFKTIELKEGYKFLGVLLQARKDYPRKEIQ